MRNRKLINDFIQRELSRQSRDRVSATEAARWLDEAGLLKDSVAKKGLPLRKLLRNGLIVGQRRDDSRRWYIESTRQGIFGNSRDTMAPSKNELLPVQREVLPDIIGERLLVVFVGTTVGNSSADKGHYYHHPSNSFYRDIFAAGLTPRLLSPDEDRELPQYGIGLTDIVKDERCNDDSLLTTESFARNISEFKSKMLTWQPRWICFNGKKAYIAVTGQKSVYGAKGHIASINCFVVPSTSGRVNGAGIFDGKTRLEWFVELAHNIGIRRRL